MANANFVIQASGANRSIANATSVQSNYRVGNVDGSNLTQTGVVTLTAGSRTVTVDPGITYTFSNTMGESGGAASLTKSGDGTMVLSSTVSHTGSTTVDDGILYVNGSLTGTSGVTVAAGAVLGGTGNISSAPAVTTVNGIIAPGSSPSTINTLGTRAISFGNGSSYNYDLNTTSLGGDLINSDGPLSFDGTAVLTLNDLAPGTLPLGSRLTLLSYSGLWDGDIFSGHADGSNFVLGSNTWQINYADPTPGSNGGTFAKNVTLTTVVPEPAGMLLSGLGLTAFLLRRRASLV